MSITVTPALSTNSIFYKYEPFSYTFTGGSNFTVAGSLATYCVATTSNAIFSASNGFLTTGSPLGETLAVTSSAGTNAYTLFLNAGRFQISPATTSLVLYLSELSMYTFTSPVPLTVPGGAFSTPTLPPGLTFTAQSPTTWILSGRPTLVTASSNYLFLGSNYTTGNIVSVSLPIQVAGERFVLSPGPTSPTPLTIGTAITPIRFYATQFPLTAYSSAMTFRGSNLPPGLTLSTVSTAPPGLAVITGTPLSNASPTVTSTITASVTGLSLLTATSTANFTYSPVVVFTEPVVTTATFYYNIPASLQVTADTLYPSNATIGVYSATGLPDGMSISVTGLISGTPTTISATNSTVVTATTLLGLSGSLPLTLKVASNAITATSNVPSTQYTVGLTIPPITITFTSDAGTPITFTSNVPPGIAGESSGTSVVLSGAPALTATDATMSVTANTLGAAPRTVTITYSASNDTFTWTSVPASPFTFRQNVAITPIQFTTVATKGSAPMVYFTNTPAIPTGLYVTPAGVLQGTPTVVTTSNALSGLSATNGYVTIVSPPGFTYTVLADEALATSATAVTTLIPSAPVNVPLTIRTLSGTIPTGNITFPCYTYGLTATATAVGGTLGACVYPDIVLPSFTALVGTVSGLPIVLGLGALNPQTINRYTLRWNGSNLNVCRDNGAFAYSNIPLLSANILTGYITTNGQNTSSYLNITAGAPTVPLPTGTPLFGSNVMPGTTIDTGSGNFYRVVPVSELTPTTIPSTIRYSLLPLSNIPRDFQWGGSTLVIADGTSNLVTSSDSTTFSLVVPATGASFKQCTFMSNISSWIALNSGSFHVSSNSNPTQGWYTAQTFSTPSPRSDGGYLLRTFPTPGIANSTRITIGGSKLVYRDMTTSSLLANPTGSISFSTFATSLTDIWAMTTASKLVVGGGVDTPPGTTIQYSTDSNSFSNANNSFTTRTIGLAGNGTIGWMAIGSNGTTPGIKYSTDAITWVDVVFSTPFASDTAIGPLQFDGTSWCVFVGCNVYRHDAYPGTISDGTTWTMTTATFAGSSSTDVLYTFPTPQYTGGPPTPILYTGSTPNGPTFVSPTASSYSLYQYVPMTTLTFRAISAAGDTPVYFLASTPPAGMSWDPTTFTLSGMSVRLGTFSVDIYAQSLVGVTKKTVTFIVSQVQIGHKTPTAAAYTAYQRAKVIADAATATVNDHAVPFEVGPFLLDRPPNKVTEPEICCEK